MLSYQSARSGWKMFFFVAAFAAGAAPADARPYRDERRGFALELTEGWRIAPRFGETEAMVFERQYSVRRGHRVGTLTIRPAYDESNAVIRAELKRVWGAGRRARPLAVPMTVRWSQRHTPRAGVVGEVHLLAVGGRRFLVTLLCVARDQRRFRVDVADVLSRFEALQAAPPPPAPSPPGPSARRPAPPAKAPPAKAPPPGRVVGTWVRAAGPSLVLTEDGQYRLADLAGRFEWRRGELRLIGADGQARVFRAELRADRLELSAPSLDRPLVFTRFKPRTALAGTWVAVLSQGTLRLQLFADGRFVLGAHEGVWDVDGDALVLKKSDREVIRYTWEISADALTLSGGDLDRPLTLSKRLR